MNLCRMDRIHFFKPALIIPFILILNSARSESPFVHIVVQEEPGKVLQYAVIYREISRKTNPLINYYWHNNGKMRSSRGDFSGNLLHGNYEEFDRSGRLTGKGTFFYGTKDGDWKFWNKEGEIAGMEKWRKGFILQKISVTQTQTTTERYKNNQLHGKRTIIEKQKPLCIEIYRSGELKKNTRKLSLKSIRKQSGTEKKNKKKQTPDEPKLSE